MNSEVGKLVSLSPMTASKRLLEPRAGAIDVLQGLQWQARTGDFPEPRALVIVCGTLRPRLILEC